MHCLFLLHVFRNICYFSVLFSCNMSRFIIRPTFYFFVKTKHSRTSSMSVTSSLILSSKYDHSWLWKAKIARSIMPNLRLPSFHLNQNTSTTLLNPYAMFFSAKNKWFEGLVNTLSKLIFSPTPSNYDLNDKMGMQYSLTQMRAWLKTLSFTNE